MVYENEEVTLEVTDLLGHVRYHSKIVAQAGKINEAITQGNMLANGTYLLHIKSETADKTLHFVIAL